MHPRPGPAGLLGGPGQCALGQAHRWLRDCGAPPQLGEESSAELPPESCGTTIRHWGGLCTSASHQGVVHNASCRGVPNASRRGLLYASRQGVLNTNQFRGAAEEGLQHSLSGACPCTRGQDMGVLPYPCQGRIPQAAQTLARTG